VEDRVDVLGWVLVPTADGCAVDEDISLPVVMNELGGLFKSRFYENATAVDLCFYTLRVLH
jgi:hypothetical protein